MNCEFQKFTMFIGFLVIACTNSATPIWAQKSGKGGGGSSPSYTIVQLDDASGSFVNSVANDINDHGQVVGQVVESSTGSVLAAYWGFSGTASQVWQLSGGAIGNGINNAGEIVGNGDHMGLYWASAIAEPMPLSPLANGLESYASKINDAGVICGYSIQPLLDNNGVQIGKFRLAVAWRVTTNSGVSTVFGPIALPTLDAQSDANALNQNDSHGFVSIVGLYQAPNQQRTAVVQWTVQSHLDGSLTCNPLPLLITVGDADAFGINKSATVCGEERLSETSPTQGKIWYGGISQILNTNRTARTSALDLNDSGVLVGYGGTGTIDQDAFVWPTPTSTPIELNKFLPKRNSPFVFLKEARAVNQAGAVVGFAWTGDDHGAFLAIPK